MNAPEEAQASTVHLGEHHTDPETGRLYSITGREGWDYLCRWEDGPAQGTEFKRDLMEVYMPVFESGVTVVRADESHLIDQTRSELE